MSPPATRSGSAETRNRRQCGRSEPQAVPLWLAGNVICLLYPCSRDGMAGACLHMKRRWWPVLLCVAAAIVVVPRETGAQTVAKIPRLGWLQPNASTTPYYKTFYQGLHDLGYVEGKNIE